MQQLSTTSSGTNGSSMDEDFDIVITPKNRWYNIDLKGIWKYRGLIMLFVRRDFVSLYKQTILGPLWMLISPLLSTLLYAYIFGRIARFPTGGTSPVLFIMTGYVAWTYFSDCVSKTSATFTTNAAVFGKVYFPRLVTPISVIISNIYKFFIQLGLLALLYAFFYFFKGAKIDIGYHIIFLPLLLILIGCAGLAFGLIVSALTTRYRDLNFLVGFILQLLMYGSSVVISFRALGSQAESILAWNPMVWIIEAFRYSVLGVGTWSWVHLAYSAGFILFFLSLAIILFGKVEKTFMDTV